MRKRILFHLLAMLLISSSFAVAETISSPAVPALPSGMMGPLGSDYMKKMQAMREERINKNKEFMKSVQNLSLEEKNEAIKKHRQQQIQENMKFADEMQSMRLKMFKEQVAQRQDLTEEQKAQMIRAEEQRYQTMKQNRLERFQGKMKLPEPSSGK